MIDFALALFMVGIGLGFYVWRLQNKAEYIMVTRHRNLLKSLNMKGPERLHNVFGGDSKKLMFSVELNGEVIPYHKLYTKIDFIRSLDDDELLSLCIKVKKLHKLFLILLGISATIFMLFSSELNNP